MVIKYKIAGIILILAMLFSAYQIVATNPQAEKANANILAEAQVVETVPAEKIDALSETFENSLYGCKVVGGPQKNYVEPGSPLVTGLATALTTEKSSQMEKVQALYNYVSNNVNYTIFEDWRGAGEVLQTKRGDCTDKSIALVSMLKNAGIESYVVYGEKIDDYSHAWVSVKVDGKWLQLDPTAGNFNYVYNCLADENCKYNKYYLPIAGIFDENRVLKCEN